MSDNLVELNRSPIEVPWLVNSADDWSETFTVKQAGVPVDVSSWTFGGTVVKRRNDATLIAPIQWDMTGAALGVVRFYVDYPDTVIARGRYWYELDVDNGRRQAFQAGLVHVGFDHSELV